MMEKRGVVDPEQTRPETEDTKDLEDHLTKRTADAIEVKRADRKPDLVVRQERLPARPVT